MTDQELTIQVAEKIMGWPLVKTNNWELWPDTFVQIGKYGQVILRDRKPGMSHGIVTFAPCRTWEHAMRVAKTVGWYRMTDHMNLTFLIDSATPRDLTAAAMRAIEAYPKEQTMNNQPPITLAAGRDVETDLRKLVEDAIFKLLDECRAFPAYDPFGEDPTPLPIQQAVDNLTICKAHLAECLRVKGLRMTATPDDLVDPRNQE